MLLWVSQGEPCMRSTEHAQSHNRTMPTVLCIAKVAVWRILACRVPWSLLMIAILNPAGAMVGTNTPVERITQCRGKSLEDDENLNWDTGTFWWNILLSPKTLLAIINIFNWLLQQRRLLQILVKNIDFCLDSRLWPPYLSQSACMEGAGKCCVASHSAGEVELRRRGELYRTDNLLIPLICQPYHAIPHMPTELWPVLGQTLHVTDSAPWREGEAGWSTFCSAFIRRLTWVMPPSWDKGSQVLEKLVAQERMYASVK